MPYTASSDSTAATTGYTVARTAYIHTDTLHTPFHPTQWTRSNAPPSPTTPMPTPLPVLHTTTTTCTDWDRLRICIDKAIVIGVSAVLIPLVVVDIAVVVTASACRVAPFLPTCLPLFPAHTVLTHSEHAFRASKQRSTTLHRPHGIGTPPDLVPRPIRQCVVRLPLPPGVYGQSTVCSGGLLHAQCIWW